VVLSIYAFLVWIVWEWHHPNPVVDIRLFKRRNFATAMFFSFTVGIVLYGTTFMIPQFLQVQLGYPAVVAGEALAGGGFIMIMVLPFVGTIVSRVDPRKMMAFGFTSIAGAMYYMSSLFSLTMDFRAAFLMRTLQMFGLAFVFVPQNVLAYVGVPREKNNQISSMNSFMRNVGGSIGIALISTSIARIAQQRRNSMVAHMTPGTPAYENIVGGLGQTMAHQGATGVDATRQAYGILSLMIDRQATTLAYVEVISILAVVILCLVPFLVIMKRNRAAISGETAIH
jgi:DHA2 family multidrug resistance protein